MTGCPVCLSAEAAPFRSLGGRGYRQCPDCRAVFLEPAWLPDRDTERARYLLHRNDPSDAGYRAYLDRLAAPLLARLAAPARGLDFGCGPGPVLAGMLAEAGHSVRLYDPFFHDDPKALEGTYDFITCTEAAEHFHGPAAEFALLDRLLAPGGWLAVMTCLLTDATDFDTWYYRHDVTHVVFYRRETFLHLAAHFGWSCEFPAKDVILMRKSGGGTASL